MFRTRQHIIRTAVILILLLGAGASSMAAVSEEDRIKALYLYNFLLFVDWPKDAINEGRTIRVAVIGDDTLFGLLEGMSHKPIKGMKVIVEQLDGLEPVKSPCHVLFVGRSQRDIAPRILEKVRDEPVLTVSDMNGFTEMGGMVVFKHLVCKEHTTGYPKRFEINLSAVEHAGLTIRSRLLRLSDIVKQP